MVNLRLISLIRKEFIQILRDPRTLVLVLVIPVMQLFLLGYAATNDVRNVPLAVYNQDRGPAARQLLDAYKAADYFQLAYEVYSEEELRELIDNGQARAGMIIPPDYSQRLLSEGSTEVAFILDGSDPTGASTSLAAAQLIGQQYATQLLVERLARWDVPVWLVNTGWTGGPYGVGKRMKIAYTRAMIRAALSGGLDHVGYQRHPVFNIDMPTSCLDVPAAVLDPRGTWSDKAAYDQQAAKLAAMFVENFKTFEAHVAPGVKDAGPRL